MDFNINQNNAILTSQSISKLVEKIKNKPNNGLELKFLKEKCIGCEDAVVSLAASKGLVMLVESDVLQVSATLSELVSSLSIAKSFVGITAAICDLLQIDLRCRINATEKYKCPFNLRTPQHPLVSVLKQEQDTWINILSKINDFYENNSERIIFYANESLYPFYMYVICNPTSEVPELFQHKLWNYLIRINKQQSLDVITYVIMWLQMSSKPQSARASSLLADLMTMQQTSINDNDTKEVLLLWLTSLVYELIRYEYDPRCVILCLHETIKSYQHLQNVASSMLIILANCIILCPSVYLCSLLKLCKDILLLNLSNAFALQTIKISLLQWLSYGCTLIADSLQVANDILLYTENNTKHLSNKSKELYLNKKFYFLKSTNNHVHLAVELSILSESITADNILDWLNRADKLPAFLLKNYFNYFAALLLYEFDDVQITQKILQILQKITHAYKETTTQLLTLILYKLSNSASSDIHFQLLKALPKMAVLKENLPLILNTLELLKQGMLNLKSFVLVLFFDLWDTDGKCYPHLQNVLVANKTDSAMQLWEFHITKAYILKQICLKRPEVHGRELVGHLSEILNNCSNKYGALASAFAIEGIKALCNAGVIDISSTWNELAPKFSSETRTVVIKSLCSLMAEVSYFGSYENSDKLLEDVVTKLWQYSVHENIEVVSAAFDALQSFTVDQVSPYVPDTFKTATTESDVVSNLPFGLIKGEYWVNLLLYSQSSALDAVGNLLIKYISTEISAYRSGTYKVEGHREPQDLNYLPEHSIVRALGNYLRRQVHKWYNSTNKQVYLQCLRILSQEYTKPLPPTDWCFLQELAHCPEARSYCITLASHQVQLSGTARRFVENYIAALTHMTNNVEDIENVFKNLKYLCNSIQPSTLQPFIESSMAFSLQKEELFDDLITHIKNTLSDENLHEANRLILSQVIVNIARQLDVDNLFFTKLLECIAVLPIRYIDELSSPRLWKEESVDKLKLSVRVRCALAQKANVSPLTWLNDFIDAACFMEPQHNYVLKNIAHVMEMYRNSDFASAWILELLGHIQSTIANENKNNYHLKFLCDVFIVSLVILAGQDIFVIVPSNLVDILEHRLHLFPQSVAILMKTQCWKRYVSQVSEWLFHMTNHHDTPENYKISFYQALAALRHEEAFVKQSKWMKYISTTVSFNV